MNHRSRRIHRAFAFLLAAFVAAGVSFSYASASAQISAAKELITQQRFSEAQAILEQVLQQTAEPPAEAYYQLARISHRFRETGFAGARDEFFMALGRHRLSVTSP